LRAIAAWRIVKYHHHVVTSEMQRAVLDQVLEVAVLVNADMAASLGELGLTPARTHLLWELLHRGPSTQRVLAEALSVSPRNVTGLVDGLEQTGFVTRERHPDDRRATLVTLTAHGQAVADGMRQGHEEFARLLFSDMSSRTFTGLHRGLTELLEVLRTHVSRGPDA
jgi:DNA-binding MarR family transcriptional regulator